MSNDSELAGLLQKTRQAVLSGDLQSLDMLAIQTEAALVSGVPRDAERLRHLREVAGENAQLLAAAMKGVASARRRLQDLGGAGRFSTYGSDGRRDILGQTPTAPSRRM